MLEKPTACPTNTECPASTLTSRSNNQAAISSIIKTSNIRISVSIALLGILVVFATFHTVSLSRYEQNDTITSSPRRDPSTKSRAAPLNTNESEHASIVIALRKTNWTELHVVRRIENTKRVNDLTSSLPNFVASDEVLSFHELEEQWKPILQEDGIILAGDSTSRLLYNKLWCLMEGIFREENRETACTNEAEKALRPTGKKCKQPNTSEDCIFQATTSSNSATPAAMKLFYVAHYNLGPLPRETRELIQPLARFVFFGIPCLHSLWSPGSREKYVHTEYPTWAQRFDDYYSSIQLLSSFNGINLLLGTPVTVCEEKFGAELELVHAYLCGENLGDDQTKTKRLIKFYNHGFKESDEGFLPPAYTGPIPVWKNFRANHSVDNSLFDQTGLLECTVAALSGLQRNVDLREKVVADILGATSNGCDGTLDGRHYTLGIPLRRQLTLLLRAVQRASL